RLLNRGDMLRPGYDDPGGFRSSHLNNVTTTTFLRNQSNSAMISAVRHPLLNRGIDHDSDGLTRRIRDEQSTKRLFASVTWLSADQGPSLCSETLGSSQRPILRWRKLRARRFRIYVRDIPLSHGRELCKVLLHTIRGAPHTAD